MKISFVKYVKHNVIFAGAILELEGSAQYIRKRTSTEIISSKKHLNLTTVVLKVTCSLEIVSSSVQYIIQKMFLVAVDKSNNTFKLNLDHELMVKFS